MNDCFNSVASHVTVVTMVVVDLLIVTSLLLINQGIICDPGWSAQESIQGKNNCTTSAIDDAENAIHIVQIALLSTFMLKAFLRVIAIGGDLIEDRWQIFDCLVVMVTFCLYIALTAAVKSRTVTYSIGYLIVLRLWRIKRIHKAIVEPIKRQAESISKSHRKAWKYAEDQLKSSHVKIESQQKEIEILQGQIAALRKVVKTSYVMANTSKNDQEIHIEEDYTLQGAQQVSPGHERVPNGNIRNTYSSPTGSHHTNSLPGTPESASSQRRTDNDSVFSDRASNNFPDIVEDTQPSNNFSILVERSSAQDYPIKRALCEQISHDSIAIQILNECESSSSAQYSTPKKSQQNSANFEQNSDDSDFLNKLSPKRESKSHTLPPVFISGGMESGSRSQNKNTDSETDIPPSYDQVSEALDSFRCQSVPITNTRLVENNSDTVSKTTDDVYHVKSLNENGNGVNDLEISTQSQSTPNLAETCEKYTVKQRRLSKILSESDLLTKEKKDDKQHLLKPPPGGKLGQGYANPAFGASMTEEEFREIQRISQVPFDDSLNDGIPMTSL